MLLLGLAWICAVTAIQGVAEGRAEREALAAFTARMPKAGGEMPYDPSLRRRAVSQAAGSVIVLALAAYALRRRQRPDMRRIDWMARVRLDAAPRMGAAAEGTAEGAPVRAAVARLPAATRPAARARRRTSGTIAAERLSAIVWTDHAERQEREVA